MITFLILLGSFATSVFAQQGEEITPKYTSKQLSFNCEVIYQEYISYQEHRVFLKRGADINDNLLESTFDKLINHISSGIEGEKIAPYYPPLLEEEITYVVIGDTFKRFLDGKEKKNLEPYIIQHKKNLLAVYEKLLNLSYDTIDVENFDYNLQLVDNLIISFVQLKNLYLYKDKQIYWCEELQKAIKSADLELRTECEALLHGSPYSSEKGRAAYESQFKQKYELYQTNVKALQEATWHI